MQSITRRRFLEDSMLAAAAAAAATAFPEPVWAAEQKPGNPSNRLRVAILGCRIRGKQHAQELARIKDCEIAYVCDPDRDLAGELAAAVEKQQGSAPKAVQDMRRVFDDKRGGRGVRRHAQSLACAGGHLGHAGGQGCLCGEAGQPQRQRRPPDGPGGAQDRAHLSGRNPEPLQRRAGRGH